MATFPLQSLKTKNGPQSTDCHLASLTGRRRGRKNTNKRLNTGSNYQTTYGAIEIGSILQVNGTYTEFSDVSEIDCTGTGYSVVSAMQPLNPTVVATSDLQLAVAEPWEGVLVSVENVTVTNANLGFDEWLVSGSGYDVVIDNFLYSHIANVVDGDVYLYIRGPLNYSFGAFKIAPRSASDLLLAP